MSFVARKNGLSLFTGMSFFIMSSEAIESMCVCVCVCVCSELFDDEPVSFVS